jgi:hypothetical protein
MLRHRRGKPILPEVYALCWLDVGESVVEVKTSQQKHNRRDVKQSFRSYRRTSPLRFASVIFACSEPTVFNSADSRR